MIKHYVESALRLPCFLSRLVPPEGGFAVGLGSEGSSITTNGSRDGSVEFWDILRALQRRSPICKILLRDPCGYRRCCKSVFPSTIGHCPDWCLNRNPECRFQKTTFSAN